MNRRSLFRALFAAPLAALFGVAGAPTKAKVNQFIYPDDLIVRLNRMALKHWKSIHDENLRDMAFLEGGEWPERQGETIRIGQPPRLVIR